jgi:exopolyphosphatase/guanosine-5'-triphosphate,3'-diphosphate pyrophosphatase
MDMQVNPTGPTAALVEADGFSRSRQCRIGALVRAQRGGLRKIELQLDSETFAWQVLCARARGGEATLSDAPVRAEKHPRTASLLQGEAANRARSDPLRLPLPA